MTHPDIDAINAIITEVAATEIMPRFRRLAAEDIALKGVNDPVTVADKAAEQALTKRLISSRPGSTVVGEESFADDPAILQRFCGDSDVWVIDPIDGTRNFIEGRTEFGVMVALVRRQQTIAAWIHDPSTGDTLTAEQGSGVWLRGHKMRLAGQDNSIPKISIIGSRLKKILSRPELADQLLDLPKFDTGSATAFDYARLFTGAANFANHGAPRAAFLLYAQTKPWDHLPGLFLQSEAQGYAADLSGNPYDMIHSDKGLLVAPNPETWQSFFDILMPRLDLLLHP